MARYKPLSSGEKFGHTSVDRPFPSGRIALASGEAMYADFSQHMNYPSGHNQTPTYFDSPSGVIAMSGLNKIAESGLWEPIKEFSNSHKHYPTGIQDFGTFSAYIHYTAHPNPTPTVFGDLDYGVYIPKFIPNAAITLFNSYVNRNPEPPDEEEGDDE